MIQWRVHGLDEEVQGLDAFAWRVKCVFIHDITFLLLPTLADDAVTVAVITKRLESKLKQRT